MLLSTTVYSHKLSNQNKFIANHKSLIFLCNREHDSTTKRNKSSHKTVAFNHNSFTLEMKGANYLPQTQTDDLPYNCWTGEYSDSFKYICSQLNNKMFAFYSEVKMNHIIFVVLKLQQIHSFD